MPDTAQLVREEAIKVLFDAFGEKTADIFSQQCRGKETEEIIACLKYLLIEYFGEKKATEKINLLTQMQQFGTQEI